MSAWYSHIIRSEPIADSIRDAIDQYRASDAPITRTLIWVVAIVFAAEVVVATLFGTRSIRVLAIGSFKLHPELAWLAAPILHAGVGHALVNIAGLAIVGIPLEKHLSQRRFVIFIIATAYGSTLIGGLFQAAFTTNQVAMYGISGTVYAMAGFGLVQFRSSDGSIPATEWVAVLLGVSAAVTVLFDPFSGPYFHPDWINGGHAGGFFIGVISALVAAPE